MTNGVLSVETSELPQPPALVPAARQRIMLAYWWRHGRLPDLDDPRLFTELVQVSKLVDRDPRLPLMADKVRAKQIVADRLGAQWVIPTLWTGPMLPPRAVWPLPFVVKSRHGCRQHVFVRDEAHGWPAVGEATRRWMRRPYGVWLDEWLYRAVPRGLLVEPFVGEGGVLPIDYKLYVFGGEVAAVQVHLHREHRHRWMLFDPDWQPMSRVADAARPRSLHAMIAAARALADGFDFMRVDFYEVRGRPLFGEMTFYPGSGLDPFDPVGLDAELGAMWLAARQKRGCAMTTPLPMQAVGAMGA